MRTKQLKRFSMKVAESRRRNRQKATKELKVDVIVVAHRQLQVQVCQAMIVGIVARNDEVVHAHVQDREEAAQEANTEVERRKIEIARGVQIVKMEKLILVTTPEATPRRATSDKKLCRKSLRKSEKRRREMNTKVDLRVL